MRTGNPALREQLFQSATGDGVMTLNGALNRTAILLLLVVVSAGFTWTILAPLGGVAFYGIFIAAVIAGLVLALTTAFKPVWAHITAPLYALCEGVVIGGLSMIMEYTYPGIVLQAIGLTFGTLFIMLLIYRAGWIKATRGFKLGLMVATASIALIYLVSFVMSFFTDTVLAIHQSGTIGIIFSLVVVGVAALNFILDFDFIEAAVKARAPAHMEWYAAFGLIVTLVWLYIEILRLLSKLRDN